MKNIAALMFLLCFVFAAQAQSDIRKVDFKNFTYEAACAGEDKTKITVKDGEFSEEKRLTQILPSGFTSKSLTKLLTAI